MQPNVIPGDLTSNLIRMLHREEIEAGGPMPPTKELKPEIIQIFERWVLGGAPNTAADAAAAKPCCQPGNCRTASGTLPRLRYRPTASHFGDPNANGAHQHPNSENKNHARRSCTRPPSVFIILNS